MEERRTKRDKQEKKRTDKRREKIIKRGRNKEKGDVWKREEAERENRKKGKNY